jgi:peptide/nickel transport system permease protein
MSDYIVRRLLLAVPTLALVMLMVFSVIRLIPGDVVELMVSEQAYAADKEALREELGLNDPVYEQFGRWVWALAHGDLGQSLWTKQAVTEELRNRFPVTAELGLYAILVGLIIALPIGVLSAVRQDTLADYVARSFAIAGISVPYFWTATLVIVFMPLWFNWSPPLRYVGWRDGPVDHLYVFLVPALLLGVYLSGSVMRMTRTMMLEVLRQDYVRTAWAKGLSERVVVVRHALKNALIPVVTIVGLQLAAAVSGTVIIESIFNLPGVGRYFYEAIIYRDYPSIQGTALVIAVAVILINILVDVTYAYLDPRIRYR